MIPKLSYQIAAAHRDDLLRDAEAARLAASAPRVRANRRSIPSIHLRLHRSPNAATNVAATTTLPI